MTAPAKFSPSSSLFSSCALNVFTTSSESNLKARCFYVVVRLTVVSPKFWCVFPPAQPTHQADPLLITHQPHTDITIASITQVADSALRRHTLRFACYYFNNGASGFDSPPEHSLFLLPHLPTFHLRPVQNDGVLFRNLALFSHDYLTIVVSPKQPLLLHLLRTKFQAKLSVIASDE